jgi:tRNA threonylcarbamoyladenosine biosynthesis protein TsaB
MKILVFDTSTNFLSLAVSNGDKVLAKSHSFMRQRHSAKLIPLMEKLLKRAKLKVKDIDYICVGKGPGSFTGLRIGITTAKALGLALEKPIVAIPSPDILAQNAEKFWGRVCTIIDARQNQVYAGIYNNCTGKMKRESKYLLLPVAEVLDKLKGEVFFLGDGIDAYCAEILKAKNIQPVFAQDKLWYPRAELAIPLALERIRTKKFDDCDSLVPLYLYPKECQIKPRA